MEIRLTPVQGMPADAVGHERSSVAARFGQAAKVAFAAVAIVVALFAVLLVAHAGPMLTGVGCRWFW